jgi:hypothetical protein
MRLAQLHDKMAAGREIPKHAPTPSPRSPNNSTDGLLPSVCEIREVWSSSYPIEFSNSEICTSIKSKV